MYTYLPYSKGGSQMVKIAFWTPAHGFKHLSSVSFFQDKFQNFYGAKVNVTSEPYMPYWDEEEVLAADGSKTIVYRGSDYRMVDAIASALNFTVRVLPTSSWTELIRAGHDGHTDVGVGAVFQDMVGMLLGQNLPRWLSHTSSSRVLVAAWLIFALILGLAYRGNLTASLTFPKYPPRPETLKEIIDSVDMVTMPSYGKHFRKFYSDSESPLFQALGSLMNPGPSLMEGLKMALVIRSSHLDARKYIQHAILDKFTEKDGSTPLYVTRGTVSPNPCGWPIPHDAPYKSHLDRLILATLEAGLYDKWTADLMRETKLRSQRRQRQRHAAGHEGQAEPRAVNEDGLPTLTINHTQGAFILFLLGLVFDILVFSSELLSPMVVAAAAEHQYAREAGAGNLPWRRNCPSQNARSAVYTYLPYSPDGSQVVKIAFWTPARGFKRLSPVPFFTDKFYNFYGAKVNVTAKPFMPYWGEDVEQHPGGSRKTVYLGSDYQLLAAVASAMNFTVWVMPTPSWAEDMVGSFLGQGLPYWLSRSSSTRVVVTAWVIFAFIIATVYRSNLTAALTLPKYPSRPETLQEIVDTVDMVTLPAYGEQHRKFYSESKSPLFQALGRLMNPGPSLMEGLRKALVENTRLYVSSGSIFPSPSAWPIPHDAPYKAHLDRWIVATLEAGLYEKWIADLLRETKLKSQRRQRQRLASDRSEQETGVEKLSEGPPILTLSHTQGGFILLMLGLILATFAFVQELCCLKPLGNHTK
ncbi:hypothetical protein O3P69_004501 [Scylla paramamosain]|uniref:Ionotropic glutamate receptor C-terminal domain-containing protein n=1 Tax=Scylla paramamosain TaxID=85552 RepID=A0AAW0UCG5_SCYPA